MGVVIMPTKYCEGQGCNEKIWVTSNDVMFCHKCKLKYQKDILIKGNKKTDAKPLARYQ